jgi:hypothetical protein
MTSTGRKSSIRHQHSIGYVQINGEYSFKPSITQEVECCLRKRFEKIGWRFLTLSSVYKSAYSRSDGSSMDGSGGSRSDGSSMDGSGGSRSDGSSSMQMLVGFLHQTQTVRLLLL